MVVYVVFNHKKEVEGVHPTSQAALDHVLRLYKESTYLLCKFWFEPREVENNE